MFRGAFFAIALTVLLVSPGGAARCDEGDRLAQQTPDSSGFSVAQGKGLAQPQVAVDSKGVIHVVYGREDAVYYAASTDGGIRCSEPVEAFGCRNMSLGMRRGPRLAVSGETVVVTAIGGEQGKGRDGDVHAWRREADGTWRGPVRVNDVVGSAREGLHGMASGVDGTIWCVWIDLRDPGTTVYGARSTDGGKSWGRNILVYRSPEKSVCECCHPSVAVGPGNNVVVLFRNSLGGNRDMFVATSSDGETFAAAKPLSTRTWKLAACPMDGGMLALSPGGTDGWGIYRREKQVFLAPFGRRKAGEVETLLGPGDQPTIAALATGPVAVWTSAGSLLVKGPGDKSPRQTATDARFPVVASDPGGELAALVWEEQTREKLGSMIRLKVFPAAAR